MVLVVNVAVFRLSAGEVVVLGGADHPPPLEFVRRDSEELDQVLVKTRRQIVVVLNLPGMPHADLIDEPAQMRHAAQENFRASRILLRLHACSVVLRGYAAVAGMTACTSRTWSVRSME